MNKKLLIFFLLSLVLNNVCDAQGDGVNPLGQDAPNIIYTGVPFLMIAPDARSGAMGDVGVSSSPDVYSMHWNPAKYAFIENNMGFAISYSPWLKKIVPDINLYSINYYGRFDDRQTFAASLRYFTLGDINFYDQNQANKGTFHPNEFSIDASYSRKLSENFSAAITARFIHSDLTQGQVTSGFDETNAGVSIAADISMYWRKEIHIGNSNAILAFGLNLSNIGSKISYTGGAQRQFIPMNMRFGPSIMIELDSYNTLSFMLDVNKLLVPTPPIYDPISGDIISGKDPNVSVVSGLFRSFFDAPGGFKEELRELQLSFGTEYWYNQQFALRAGYFHEHRLKGNRKFFTIGAGLKYNVFGLDFSYLIPTEQQHPLENTIRFSLLFVLEGQK